MIIKYKTLYFLNYVDLEMDPSWVFCLTSGFGSGYTIQEKIYLLMEVLDFYTTNNFMPIQVNENPGEGENDPVNFDQMKASVVNRKLRKILRNIRQTANKSIVEYPENVEKGPGKLENVGKAPTTIEINTTPSLNVNDAINLDDIDMSLTIPQREGALFNAVLDSEIEDIIQDVQNETLVNSTGGFDIVPTPMVNSSQMPMRVPFQVTDEVVRSSEEDLRAAGSQEAYIGLNSPYKRSHKPLQTHEYDAQLGPEDNDNESTRDYYMRTDTMDESMLELYLDTSSHQEGEHFAIHPLPRAVREIIQTVSLLPSYRFPIEISNKLVGNESDLV